MLVTPFGNQRSAIDVAGPTNVLQFDVKSSQHHAVATGLNPEASYARSVGISEGE